MNIDIKQVVKIVRQAGEMFKTRDFDVNIKTSISDKVTSMDIAVEKYLKEHLTALIDGCGFLGRKVTRTLWTMNTSGWLTQ